MTDKGCSRISAQLHRLAESMRPQPVGGQSAFGREPVRPTHLAGYRPLGGPESRVSVRLDAEKTTPDVRGQQDERLI